MKALIRHTAALLFIVFLSSCKKDNETTPLQASVSNTSWLVTVTATGNTSSQNIFEFNNGGGFAWHPAAAASYTGTWTQNGSNVSFVFKETTTNGDYSWDNTGTLSDDGKVLTGTMQRRGAQGSGSFTAKKL